MKYPDSCVNSTYQSLSISPGQVRWYFLRVPLAQDLKKKKCSAGQNCCRKIGFDYMPLSHFGSIQSFSGLPLLADTLPGHLRFRPFALFFPGRPPARSFWTSAIQRAYGGLLCRPELFFRPDRNLLKLLDFLNCFYGPSILHLFISFCGTIHMASCESE